MTATNTQDQPAPTDDELAALACRREENGRAPAAALAAFEQLHKRHANSSERHVPVPLACETSGASSLTPDQLEPSTVPVPDPPEKVLERFDGFVEKVEDETAYVTLRTSRGERLHGPYPASELKAAGVGERNRFVMTTLDLGRDVRIEITSVPPVVVSPERQREIQDETERLFEGFDPADDY
jgi:hypothetical protein